METDENSVSYQPIMPPVWCSLPTDPDLYERPLPMEVPEMIALKEDSQCACGAKYDPTLPTIRMPCIIYTLLRAVNADIQLQQCRVCKPRSRQFVGPDAREFGLFNWNNRLLFTHDLLDEYTNTYSTSETPFAAWVLVAGGRYETYRSNYQFTSVGLFRSVWFTFVHLQNFSNDMSCAICGPSPKVVIWDGVTVAFSKKKILPSLQPPTTLSTNSPVRNDIRYYPAQQLIPDRETRQLILKSLSSHEQMRKEREDRVSNMEDIEYSENTHARDHAETMKLAEEKLRHTNDGLGIMFAQKLGSESGSTTPPLAYYELFRQVCVDQMIVTYLIPKFEPDRYPPTIQYCGLGPAMTWQSSTNSCSILHRLMHHAWLRSLSYTRFYEPSGQLQEPIRSQS